MSEHRVKQAIEELQRAIDEDAHRCEVHVEIVDGIQDVSFYLDPPEDGAEAPTAVITLEM